MIVFSILTSYDVFEINVRVIDASSTCLFHN